jgi:GT2 family glycosyltransferase
MDSVWIVLVDYNGIDDTRRCLASLDQLVVDTPVVVVDNASKTNVAHVLENEFPRIKFVRSEVNGGWAGGNNIGLKYAIERGAKTVILLNNDTIVSPDLVIRLQTAFQAQSEYGILGPVIRFMEPPSEVQTDGVVFNRPRKHGFFQRREVPLVTADPPQVTEVDIVNGCCMAIRSEVVEAIGYIDEQFFLIHEESDFCLRAQRAGFKNGVLSEALVWHKGSSTFKREGSRLQRYFDSRNLIRLISKHGSRRSGRGKLRSIGHHLRYSYHRYAIERENKYEESANAVLEGLYDGALSRWGPYSQKSRPGIAILRYVFDLGFKFSHKS